ncbi:uncharacterized protein E6C27_scaffold82G003390 [Cucumis melo var. makuwa]|uniref:Uncharacterized protein n=1 Tax=Cucumis melo var. makuwa TaxID=1194695 RepID=A0A5A7VGJ7_CUCMM|nr:uncharacterized protein E6C27_scaffold82G003390 [Cucumis melo var. makuwa]
MATIATTLTKINLVGFSPPRSSSSRSSFSSARCSPIQQVQVDSTIECEPCNGKGWIVCDFCEGQKTNVKAENNRIYRRCPSCRANSKVKHYVFNDVLESFSSFLITVSFSLSDSISVFSQLPSSLMFYPAPLQDSAITAFKLGVVPNTLSH